MSDIETWKKKCDRHGKEQILFCNESECLTPICLMCLKDMHKGHDFSDLQDLAEESRVAVLEDIRWMKEALQKKKEDLWQAHDLVIKNCKRCAEEVLGAKERLVSEIDKNTADMLHKITEIKKEADAKISPRIDEIYKRLKTVNKLEKLANSETIFDAERENLEKLRCEKKEIQSWFPETIPYIALTYENCGSKAGSISPLCGKLITKNKQFESTESMSNGSSSQEKGVPIISAKTSTATSTFNCGKNSNTETVSQENKVGSDDSNEVKGTTDCSFEVNSSSLDESEPVAKATEENVRQPGGNLRKESAEQKQNTDFCSHSTKGRSPFYSFSSPRSSCSSPSGFSSPSSYSRGSDRCPSPSLYDCVLFDDVNASAGRGSTTMRGMAASDDAGGTLDSLLQIVERKAAEYVPIAPVNAAPDGAVINQSTWFEPPSDAISSACFGRNGYNSGGGNLKKTVAGRKGKNGADFSAFLVVKPPEMKSNFNNFSKRGKENDPPKVPPAENKKPKRSPGFPLGGGNPLGVYTAARKKLQGFSYIIGKPKKSKSRRDDIGVDPVAKKARLELIPNNGSHNIFCIRSKALHSINTGFGKLGVISVLPDGSIIISDRINYTSSPRKSLRPTLKMYQANTGKLLWGSFNTNLPDGMAVVTAAGRQCVALSYCKPQMIEFYEVTDLHSPLHSHLVTPDNPRRLCPCPSSPRMLAYVDCKPDKQVAKWLDCSDFPPKITKETIIQIPNDFVQEMCCVVHEDKHLLVTTHNHGGVQAYLTGTDKLEWCVRGRQPGMNEIMNAIGITANGRGQLLVCDVNNGCIQMLSTDGRFMGTVLRSGEQMLGIPRGIRWCEKRRSLVVAHEKESLFKISIFQC